MKVREYEVVEHLDTLWTTRGEAEEHLGFVEVMSAFSKTVRELSEINKEEGCYRYDYVKYSTSRINYPRNDGNEYNFKEEYVVLKNPQKVEEDVKKERAPYESIRNRYKEYLYSCFIGDNKNDKDSCE